jgi:hypothetical protein
MCACREKGAKLPALPVLAIIVVTALLARMRTGEEAPSRRPSVTPIKTTSLRAGFPPADGGDRHRLFLRAQLLVWSSLCSRVPMCAADSLRFYFEEGGGFIELPAWFNTTDLAAFVPAFKHVSPVLALRLGRRWDHS